MQTTSPPSLHQALDTGRPPETLVAVCAWCSDAADREAEIRRKHPRARITHGICPTCRAKHFPTAAADL